MESDLDQVVQICLYNSAVALPAISSFFISMCIMNNKDTHLDLFRKLGSNPEYAQRELSQQMGVSLGMVNYCMKKLTEKGWVKLTNFSRSSNKFGYAYLRTTTGIEEKSRLTFSFLLRKLIEYEILKKRLIR